MSTSSTSATASTPRGTRSLLSSLSDAGVREIALRSGQLSPAHRGVLKGLLDHLQSLERDQPDEKR
ncbi:hypothetical protein [Saccharopolyspora pogona]|uniref:hypothetical protein n=1 Tax=Saccharopolyspora pogona TaxID=333966 RepID=UPI00168409FA|nr:hypothetical protein [Saccharopolyspora pogona]